MFESVVLVNDAYKLEMNFKVFKLVSQISRIGLVKCMDEVVVVGRTTEELGRVATFNGG